MAYSYETFAMTHVHERLVEINTVEGEKDSLDEQFEFEPVTEEQSLDEESSELKSEIDGQEAKLKNEECSVVKSETEEHTIDEGSEKKPLAKGENITCETCNKQFNRRDVFLKHMKSHFESFSCEHCGKHFNRRDSFTRHVKKHEQKKIVCHLCEKEFTNVEEKYMHLKETHGVKRSEAYSPEFKILAVKRVKEIGIVNAAKELNIWESTLANWEKLVFNPLNCTFCGKRFTRENNLKVHVELVHMKVDTNGHHCDQCAKVFPSPSNLKRHLINCKGYVEKKYVQKNCDICHKTFTTGYGLVEHIRFVHKKERDFVCEYCTKAFARKKELTYHVSAVHEKSGEFKCGFCDKIYHRQHEKVLHERTHTGEKPFVCDVCGKAFSRKNSLQRHSELHGEKPYVCGNCGEGYTSYKARRILLACEKCHVPLTPVAHGGNENEAQQEIIEQEVNNDSLIRNRKGPDIDLQELYNDQFSTNEDDIGPKNIEGFMKVEMKEGCDNEVNDNGVKEEPIDDNNRRRSLSKFSP